MKSLIIDFNNYNGHHMTLTRKQPFHKSELHELELNMLQDNVISTLLPLTWLEVNEELSFQYKIEGYRLLTHYLRKEQLTMQHYYSLLLSLTDALATCYEYMLRPECCLVDEHMIYIDEQQKKLLLTYLPLREPVYEQQAQQLLVLAVRWADLVSDLDTAGYHRILNLLSTEKLAITPLRQLLLDLIHQQSQLAEKPKLTSVQENIHSASHLMSSDIQGPIASNSINYDDRSNLDDRFNININEQLQHNMFSHKHPQLHAEHNESLSTKEESSAMSSELRNSSSWDELEVEDLYDEYRDEAAVTWKHGLLGVLMLAVIGLAWKQLYMEQQSLDNLLLCCGITLGIIALLVFVSLKPVRRWILHIRNKKERLAASEWDSALIEESEHFEAEDGQRFSRSIISFFDYYQNKSNQHMDEQSNSKQENDREGESILQEAVSVQSKVQNHKVYELATVPLDEAQATSLLQRAELIVVRSMNGAEEPIHIVGQSFLVGRAEEGVHYREVAKGVSRIHIEFEIVNGRLHVKDTGSRNGTYLNGQLMIAYKSYPLNPGDKLQLASKEGPIYECVS